MNLSDIVFCFGFSVFYTHVCSKWLRKDCKFDGLIALRLDKYYDIGFGVLNRIGFEIYGLQFSE